MKLQIKNLHGDTYDFEIEDNETVKALKDKISARDDLKEKYVSDLIKLLYAGNVMEDEDMLSKYTIKPDGFLVLVKQTPGKPKPPPKKKPTSGFGNMMGGFNSSFGMSQAFPNNLLVEPPYTQSVFPQPLSQSFSSQASTHSTYAMQTQLPGMGTTGEPFYPTENSHTTNEEQKQAVEQLVTMGFARSQAEKALRTCGYSVEIAIESLTSGNIPLEDDYPPPPIATGLMPTPAPISTTASSTSIIQQKSSSSSNIPSENSTGTGLNLQELGRTLEKHPEQLETLKERLKSQHPEVAQLIEDDPQAFLELVRQAGELEKPTTTDSTDTVRTNTASTSSINTGANNSHNSGPASASFNAHELQTIKRIEDMGFERARVIEAFLACERNEELAVHYLLNFFNN